MATLRVPPSIRDLRGQAIEAIIKRLQQIDLSPLLVYRIDSVPNAVLPFLQWQFDIQSPQWILMTQNLAPGSAGLRQLIKQAIPLHRTLGTPSAIITACAALGWPGATLLEGQNSWGGSSWPSNQGWAVFRVQFTLSPTQVVTAIAIAQLVAVANFFKPERCWLDSISFVLPSVADTGPDPTDILTLSGTLSIIADAGADPSSDALTLTQGVMATTKDPYPFISPNCDGHFFCTGHHCGANFTEAADGPIVINGVAQNAQ